MTTKELAEQILISPTISHILGESEVKDFLAVLGISQEEFVALPLIQQVELSSQYAAKVAIMLAKSFHNECRKEDLR